MISYYVLKLFNADVRTEITFFFSPVFNPVVIILINSRRIVGSEHPFMGKKKIGITTTDHLKDKR